MDHLGNEKVANSCLVSREISEKVQKRVEADLRPSPMIVYGKSAIAVLLGGVISLFFCGQFGLGFSHLAHNAYGWIIDFAGPLGCTALCGAVFAVIPVGVLRLISSPIQFRVLITKEWRALILWIGVFGMGVIYANESPDPLWDILVWSAAAIMNFGLLSQLIDRITAKLYQRRLGLGKRFAA